MFDIKKVSWNEVREQVNSVNPELAEICDYINPNERYQLFKIRYPYGAKIVDTGTFNIPALNNELIPLSDERVPAYLKEKLGYCRIPLSLILHNNNEVFVESTDRVIPLNFFKKGNLFGVFESAGALAGTLLQPIWTVTAGARSVFMIPKIGDKAGHGKIKKELGISSEAPTNLLDQWETFKDITYRGGGLNLWYNEILVFSNAWLNPNCKNASWLKFQQYLFKTNWTQSKLLMDSIEFGLIFASFSEIISKKCLKPRPYIIDTIKHLISIAGGSGVAFKPATDESSLPISFIQDIYMNLYNLKSHIPTIMQPGKLDGAKQQVYYSLACPTTLESSPITPNARSIIEDEREIRLLINLFLKTVNNRSGNNMINNNIKYEFFHFDLDKYGEILDSNKIVIDDNRFAHAPHTGQSTRTFCANALFFRGCIRVSTT